MSLITENGSGLADAESLASVAQADAYHAVRANSLWATLTTEEKEAALRRATDYMEQMYRLKWKGTRASLTQALDWPRLNVELEDIGFGRFAAYVPYNTVPKEVIQACCEMAFRAAGGELAPDLQRTVAEKTVGPIKTVYASGAPEYIRFRSVDLLLKSLLVSGGMGIRLVRA
jgi:hypothetical protein